MPTDWKCKKKARLYFCCIALQSYCKWRLIWLHSLEAFWKEQVRIWRQHKGLNVHDWTEQTITASFMACWCLAQQVNFFVGVFVKTKDIKLILSKLKFIVPRNKLDLNITIENQTKVFWSHISSVTNVPPKNLTKLQSIGKPSNVCPT